MAKPGAAAAAAAEAQVPLLLPQRYQPPPPYYGVPVGDYQEPPARTFLLVPVYPRLRRRPRCCPSCLSYSSLLALLSVVVLLGTAGFFLWPSDPDVRLARLRLRNVHVSTNHRGGMTLDVDLDLKVRVRNRDFFSIDYDEIRVGIGYRGRPLGHVTADGGHVRARGVSYVDARLRLDGIRVLEDAFFLIEDVARGRIPFDTVTEVEGQLHLFSVDFPIEGRISCSISMDLANQTVASQDCYPES